MTTVVSVERCRAVLAAAFPDLTVARLRFLAEGWDSTVFEANGTLVFRFPKRAAVDRTVQKEARLLPLLAPALPVPVPRFTHLSGPVLGHPWHVVGYPKLPGAPLASLPLAGPTVDALAPALAAFLRALHGFPTERAAAAGVPVFAPAAWVGRHAALVELTRGTVRARLGPSIARSCAAFWEGYVADALSAAFEPALIHGDLGPEHVLVAGGRLGGVIDFGDAMVADPALDFAGFPRALARAVLDRYGGDDAPAKDALWARREALVRAVPLHAIAAGLELEREDLVAEGIEGVRRLHTEALPP
jgi:aminoglycoside phosphotransferase (APT) family kinase protein